MKKRTNVWDIFNGWDAVGGVLGCFRTFLVSGGGLIVAVALGSVLWTSRQGIADAFTGDFIQKAIIGGKYLDRCRTMC